LSWGSGLAVGLSAAAVAWACGYSYKQLLMDREGALKSPITVSFQLAARRFVEVTGPALPVVPRDAAGDDGADLPGREEAEGQGLSDAQRQQVLAMRQAPDASKAEALGAGLPEEVRRYTAAAVGFQTTEAGACAAVHEADDSAWDDDGEPWAPDDADLGSLVARFESVLTLPPAQRRQRGAWAAFALGRLMAGHCRWDEAATWFQRTRQVVGEGAADPLHLGVASLGEEARVRWHQKRLEDAFALYAQQAARGSQSGTNSLRHVADHVLSRPALWPRRGQAPTMHKVLTTYALFESDQALSAAQAPAVLPASAPASGPEVAAPLSTGAAVLRWLDTTAAWPAEAQSQPDALAALALTLGRWDQARRLAAMRDTSLAHWVQAKLALRDGRLAQAAEHYRLAVGQLQAVDLQPRWGQDFPDAYMPAPNPWVLLKVEQGILSLSRGDFVQALHQLYTSGGYWLELAYVADRVLTLGELQAYVDAHVPAQAAFKAASASAASAASDVASAPATDPAMPESLPAPHGAAELRTLLARRLMRAHRYDDALRYFHADGDERFGDPQARLHAQAYIRAIRQAPKAWSRQGRAQAWWTAATLMREHGMEMVGFELAPDGAVFGGGLWADSPPAEPAALSTRAERQRVAQSGDSRLPRYHYRLIAAELAERAAANLPFSSTDYASTLCVAASWRLSVGDQKGAWRTYQTYVKNGPALPWASHFGRDCPQPELAATGG
jgi:hypothetical protein